jgi:pimeloyl-ACP methyl ester carboxylesterase
MQAYDEFGLFHENAAEWGLDYSAPAVVRREAVDTGNGVTLSALVWGTSAPELVLLHGGGQNAHTWDTVALALGRPLVAIDLPGHGHSDPAWNTPGSAASGTSADATFGPHAYASHVVSAIEQLAPSARCVTGMSLGGLTSIAVTSLAPQLVRRLALVDVLPSIRPNRAAPIAEFLNGPESFASFDEILERTMKYNPTRSESSLRRGVLHNAVQRPDGRWVWRHQQHWDEPARRGQLPGEATEAFVERNSAAYSLLWDDLSVYPGPIMLVRGLAPGTIIADDDVLELLRRRPDARVESVEGAGHSVQGDRPLDLAALLADYLDTDHT